MSAYSKLMIVLELLQNSLRERIIEFSLDEDLVRLKLILKKSIKIYINFNNYNEYSYVIHFSPDPMDRIIIDNYDVKWNVDTAPHHLHTRFEKEKEQEANSLESLPQI
ncbi:MAG: hypothetical protein HeimC2_36900 [Candidatus Heimdallarchaeota archaeon LC_2]|nr:MAG: hypothetical protein HeimC2_44850 [Candidatus Heimdallarchaeota archaeon LC_2]OLS20532.1 MAG: hypothetical protein HeimC2_36900 [Candidatus Heimdallarchaeota archaeon LC_2]